MMMMMMMMMQMIMMVVMMIIVRSLDEYPTHGLGTYDDYETSEDFSGYLWATWTTMEAQPMQIDPALQAMIDQSTQKTSGHWP